MRRSRPRYPSEYRRQMVDLVRSGRSPDQLAREFEPSAQSIRNWVSQADRDEGRRADGLTTVEREELRRLRRDNRRLREERQALRPLASHPYRALGARQQEAAARRRLVAPTVQVQRRSLREYSEAVR